jgi:hypothetical protein
MNDRGRYHTEAGNKLEELETLSPEAMRQHCLEVYKRELEDKVKDQDDVRGYALICALKYEGVRTRDRNAQEAAEFLAESSRHPINYTYWGKAAYWTVEEACALLSGIRPTKHLRGEDILRLADYAAPAKRFADLQQLLLRENNDSPYVKLLPSDVLAWARSLDIEVPRPLSDAVDRFANLSPEPAKAGAADPLDSRERTTLLCIIGALAAHAQLDLSQPLKTGNAIAAMMPDVKLSGRTIGEHLKAVREAMDSRKII